MAKKRKNDNDEEIQQQKSPAEFFAEHQAIAGFDNMGKSLYTSIRELVENSLDACESIGVLPQIQISVQEITTQEFNKRRGIKFGGKGGLNGVGGNSSQPTDVELFQSPKVTKSKGRGKRKTPGSSAKEESEDLAEVPVTPVMLAVSSSTTVTVTPSSSTATPSSTNAKSKKASGTPSKKQSQGGYFVISVRDNGCGMRHEAIPNLLGRVLSGSKYGVRQTRGKFGLGAKMALIWSQKSTGMPIQVVTSHRTNSDNVPKHKSTCVLDIDISNNCPRISKHTKQKNEEEWIGTELELWIAGNWTTYKSRIVQYFQQLAIITPYAQLEFQYSHLIDTHRNLQIRYDRRSEQMPEPAKQVKHHPSSVNNLVIQQLLEKALQKFSNADWTLVKFLSTELSSISTSVAGRIVKECGWSPDHAASALSDRDITKLVQVLRNIAIFKAPDGSCLSPLGEYNLNLGIRKVLQPDYVATARDKAGAYDGHPFIVEAAVSLGGGGGSGTTGSSGNGNLIVREGISVLRFANRIPLLFEGGADVSTRVAMTKMKWSNYKIDPKRDKIGVFVSIVSTKIPYKGTGKEYIGDDIVELSQSVKRVLQLCCQQLRTVLLKRNALRDQRDRKSKLTKYIPDVSRALFGLLEEMRDRRSTVEDVDSDSDDSERTPPPKRVRPLVPNAAFFQSTLEQLENGDLDEKTFSQKLHEAVTASTTSVHSAQDDAANNGGGNGSGGDKNSDRIPIYLKPIDWNMTTATNDVATIATTTSPATHDEDKKGADEKDANEDPDDTNALKQVLDHPFFVFRPLVPSQ